ncbi:unnamed protein product [Leptosia nina]|uniref:LisH domain-containing protein n=1 Tax=Leptosia nina TaxID=320188 RepID=A0AAV1JIV1_9NEOP
MAQTEDTELRDLVIDALEKNGSLAKIRALLRANIFLAFEDDCENIKQNEALDNILKIPEGILSLSIIHEFLEFCNLKNTLFVYMSESRQGKEYKVKSQRSMIDTLRLNQVSTDKEPVLLTLLKHFIRSHKCESSHESCDQADHSTYTVDQDNDTSSSTSRSHSDNSSDEKNRIDLRLPLDNSDTDTSSNSTRNKNSSEYVPNKNIVVSDKVVTQELVNCQDISNVEKSKSLNCKQLENSKTSYSSTDSTSYAELKPFNLLEEKLLNTAGLPYEEGNVKKVLSPKSETEVAKGDFLHTLSSASSESVKREVNAYKDVNTLKHSPEQSCKYDHTPDYSYDFSSPPVSEKTSTNVQQNTETAQRSNSYSNNQNSPRSASSISISEVADLISEKSYSSPRNKNMYNMSKSKSHSLGKNCPDNISKSSNDTGDFSQSPIPSLSNLSLDYHSD